MAGVQKAGTTVLDAYLRHHPAIQMPMKAKELHYFDNEQIFAKGGDGAFYHRQFPAPIPGYLRGEVTPIYSYWYDAPRRIWHYNPAMKIILCLRNPIERAYSHWAMERARGMESLDFLPAVKQEQQRCREALPLQHRVYSYLDRGYYSEQIRRLWHFYPPEQTLILRHETLRDQPKATLNRLFDFLGIAALPYVEPQTRHQGKYHRSMTAEEKGFLINVFKPEIIRLESMLGWNCADWLVE